MTYSVSVTIGRNVGSEPMGEVEWRMFCDYVSDSVAFWCRVRVGEVGWQVSHSYGVGEWDDVPEDNYTVTAYGIGRLSDAAQVFESVQGVMRGYAGIWRQDAIAVTLGTVALVSPSEG